MGRQLIRNFGSLVLKRNESLILNNKFKLSYFQENNRDIKELFLFSLESGVAFSDKKGFWNYDSNKSIVTTPEGIKFKLKGFDSLIFSETFIYDIHYSENLEGKTVIQAGGFIGDTALYYASKGAKVYSFEPNPDSFMLALENIKLNPELSNKIIYRNYAIGTDEVIDFGVNEKVSGASSAFVLGKNKVAKVRSISIAKILEEFNIDDPFLLDLDIKGKEFEVIDEMSLSRFEKVRIEYFPELVGLKENGRDILIDKLMTLGFNDIRVFKHNYSRYDLHNQGTIYALK